MNTRAWRETVVSKVLVGGAEGQKNGRGGPNLHSSRRARRRAHGGVKPSPKKTIHKRTLQSLLWGKSWQLRDTRGDFPMRPQTKKRKGGLGNIS